MNRKKRTSNELNWNGAKTKQVINNELELNTKKREKNYGNYFVEAINKQRERDKTQI